MEVLERQDCPEQLELQECLEAKVHKGHLVRWDLPVALDLWVFLDQLDYKEPLGWLEVLEIQELLVVPDLLDLLDHVDLQGNLEIVVWLVRRETLEPQVFQELEASSALRELLE